MKQKFIETIEKGYTFKGDSIVLGGAMLGDETLTNSLVKAPLKTFNRHGLIAGATGTGKTKTLQTISESLSLKGVPVLLMDIKGDLSGLAKASPGHPKIDERHEKIGIPFEASKFPVELFTISEDKGTRMRATISEFGPVLLSKILGLNDTQSGAVALVFKLCDDEGWPLLDLKDFKKMLQYVSGDGKAEVEKNYGSVASSSVGAIMRKIIEIEAQGGELFFGEKSFETDDLLRLDDSGKGFISVLRLTDIQNRPKLFSTFMLCLLAEIYEKFPEQGDADKPKLVIFLDEAHLIFDKASNALLEQIESIVKLIRSKGVGLFFVTQNPTDVPDSILGQLGMKVQHALRAFTAKDRKAIKLTAENYPITEFYKTDEVLTKLGIGEALITVLNEKGIPSPLARTMLHAPRSLMGTLTEKELNDLVRNSEIAEEYNEVVDRESAYEILEAKFEKKEAEEAKAEKEKSIQPKPSTRRTRAKKEKAWYEDPGVRQIGRTVARELTRGLLGVLGVKSTRRRRKSSFF